MCWIAANGQQFTEIIPLDGSSSTLAHEITHLFGRGIYVAFAAGCA